MEIAAKVLRDLQVLSLKTHKKLIKKTNSSNNIEAPGWLKVFKTQLSYENYAYELDVLDKNKAEYTILNTKQIKNFPEKYTNKKVITYPLVRNEFYKTKTRKINNDKFRLLIVGGSQGASIFDKNLKKSILNISKKFSIKVIQQTHLNNLSSLKEFYAKNNVECDIFNYDKNFIDKVAVADLCITRAGATTLAELSTLEVPFIAVPLPNSKDNHQFENANFYVENNACWILDQGLFEEKIEQLLEEILSNKTNINKKIQNLSNLNFQNTWLNVNQKIVNILDEN